MQPHADRSNRGTLGMLLVGLLLIAAAWTVALVVSPANAADEPAVKDDAKPAGKKVLVKDPFPYEKPKAPKLDGGLAWLNTAGPIEMSKLRGKVVILDFWTYCCINCIHILPKLAALEEEFPNELVVIGVHSAKFEGERDTVNIRDAVLRYEIKHPVVNDGKMEIWQNFGARSWPTLMVVDPEGNIVGSVSGEGHEEVLRQVVKKLIEYHEAKGTLDRTPLHFEQEQATAAVTPLRYPGKVLPDPAGNRLFIADSTHHRIVVADLKTFEVKRVIGSGRPGLKDGGPIEARFSEPQGMALDGETLYVADTKNHALRAGELQTGTTTLGAGDGRRGFERTFKGPGKTVSLASPWDLLRIDRTLYIAMAGTHQIWTMNLDDGELANMAGSGREDIIDGTYDSAAFAQPSGLATDGEWLYVADSEVSGVRKVSLTKPVVETVVGEGLFDFGDKDGVAGAVRLQHALGVAYADGVLYVA
ncbi:MAG: thioredoxin-like domain-containing protein, partial [Planctomycetia bacterium]